jgi:hypothetical protein
LIKSSPARHSSLGANFSPLAGSMQVAPGSPDGKAR